MFSKKITHFIIFSLCLIWFAPIILYAQGKGHVQIRCEPGLKIFLDGNFHGTSNESLEGFIIEDIIPGQHILKVVKKGYVPKKRKIEIKSGEVYSISIKDFIASIEISQEGKEKEIALQPKTGNLIINSLPVKCEIAIPQLGLDKIKKEMRKLKLENIPAGTYKVIFSALDRSLSWEGEIKSICSDKMYTLKLKYLKSLPPKPQDRRTLKPEVRLMVNFVTGKISEEKGYIFGPFVILPNRGIIIDRKSNLMWTQYYFSGTNYLFQGFNFLPFSGYSDWQFPTQEELSSLYSTLSAICSGRDRRCSPFLWPSQQGFYVGMTNRTERHTLEDGVTTIKAPSAYFLDFKTKDSMYQPFSWEIPHHLSEIKDKIFYRPVRYINPDKKVPRYMEAINLYYKSFLLSRTNVGKYKEAKELIQKVISQYPETNFMALARELSSYIEGKLESNN
jgi:hypothetical protein